MKQFSESESEKLLEFLIKGESIARLKPGDKCSSGKRQKKRPPRSKVNERVKTYGDLIEEMRKVGKE